MLETGTVIKLEDHKVLICTDQNAESAGCGGGCASCGKHNKKNMLWVTPKAGLEIQPDDKVEVYYPPGRAILAAFFVLIFPLLLFFLFYTLTASFFPTSGEMVRALIGLGGIALGFFINLLVRWLQKTPRLPEIIRKII